MHKILSILCLFVFKIVIIAQAPITLNNVKLNEVINDGKI